MEVFPYLQWSSWVILLRWEAKSEAKGSPVERSTFSIWEKCEWHNWNMSEIGQNWNNTRYLHNNREGKGATFSVRSGSSLGFRCRSEQETLWTHEEQGEDMSWKNKELKFTCGWRKRRGRWVLNGWTEKWNSPVDVEQGEDIELLASAEEPRRYVVSCKHNVTRRTERICKVRGSRTWKVEQLEVINYQINYSQEG